MKHLECPEWGGWRVEGTTLVPPADTEAGPADAVDLRQCRTPIGLVTEFFLAYCAVRDDDHAVAGLTRVLFAITSPFRNFHGSSDTITEAALDERLTQIADILTLEAAR